MTFSIIILAAGQGLRMRSALPKVLHPIGGIPMVEHVVRTAFRLQPKQMIIVYGQNGEQLKSALARYPALIFAEQKTQAGTGHAVLQALPYVSGDSDKVLILYGDAPLVRAETLARFMENTRNEKAAVGVVTANAYPPTGYGRIVRDNCDRILRIVEEKDATEDEKQITEINTGIFLVDFPILKTGLPKITAKNAQQEYYLTDIVDMALQDGLPVAATLISSPTEALGINDKQQLASLERVYQAERAMALMQQGVTLADPSRIDIRGNLITGQDVSIDVNVIFEGEVSLGNGVKVGPNVVIKNTTIEDHTEILANSVIEGAILGPHNTVGPFARIRPDTVTATAVKIGNFVETKNAKISSNTKMNHLSYVGDAVIGKHVNVGAGTITCNYDGKNKHQTTIEDNVSIGSDTQLIAPVRVGSGAVIGAGTTITKDVPPHHLIHNLIQHRLEVKEEK